MKKIFCFCILIYASALLLNDGFMASDEYWTAMTRYLPAQTSDLQHLVHEDDVKSAVQILPMHVMAQVALKLGIESAYYQYRFVILTLGLISFAVLFYAFNLLSQLFPDQKKYFFLVFSFYFAAPFALTRPMFESLSAPWLFLSLAYALRYDQKDQRLKDLIWSAVWISVAFLLRPQVGLCGLALLIPPLRHGKWKDLGVLVATGAIGFLLSGIPDIYFRGKYHYSFLAVTVYNFEHGHEYGNEPWTYYPLMMMALTALPFFIYRYKENFWPSYWKQQQLNLAFIFLFVFLHSLFPQKFERFLIPIIPNIIFALAPVFQHLHEQRRTRRLRWISVLGLNFLLFLPATFYPAQKNIINLALAINEKPELEKIYIVDESITWIPDIFIEKNKAEMIQIPGSQIQDLDPSHCNNWIIVNASQANKYKGPLFRYLPVKTFGVNYLEKAAYLLNPKNNVRRAPLVAYSCAKMTP